MNGLYFAIVTREVVQLKLTLGMSMVNTLDHTLILKPQLAVLMFFILDKDLVAHLRLKGELDELRISNSVRTAEEIMQSYEIGKRSHTVTIDFKAELDSGNLITGSGDT